MPLDALASGGASILGRALSVAELEAFDKYLQLLQKWSRSQRLIGSTDDAWIVENLFLDSLLFLKVVPTAVATIADIGSGAGLPGIPIKIVRPDIHIVLIESRAKRASFLSAVVRELGLGRTEVLTGRAEAVAVERPRAFDAAVMRCAGDLRGMAQAVDRLVRPGGVLVASGPPPGRSIALGESVDVVGVQSGQTRRFVRYQVRNEPL